LVLGWLDNMKEKFLKTEISDEEKPGDKKTELSERVSFLANFRRFNFTFMFF
jgi:hypothetical protein